MQEYASEYSAPIYSIASRKVIGRKVVTTVILEGELIEFEKNTNDENLSN